MHQIIKTGLLGLGITGCCAGFAFADIIPVAANRAFGARVDLVHGDGVEHAEGFEAADGLLPFSAERLVEAVRKGGSARLLAMQDSQIEPSRIRATGSLGWDVRLGEPGVFATADAGNLFQLTFVVSEPQSWRMFAELESSIKIEAAEVGLTLERLLGNGESEVLLSLSDHDDHGRHFDEILHLPAGAYHLAMQAFVFNEANADTEYHGGFDVEFAAVPEPATAFALAVLAASDLIRRRGGRGPRMHA